MQSRLALLAVLMPSIWACSNSSAVSRGNGAAASAGGGQGGGAGQGTGGIAAGAGGAPSGAVGGIGGAAGSGQAGGGSPAEPSAPHCTEGRDEAYTARIDCTAEQIATLQASGLGGAKSFNFGVYGHELVEPMTMGEPYAFSLDALGFDQMPVNVELWGATALCGGDIDLLDAQTLGAQTGYHGIVCAGLEPSVAFTHLVIVIRGDGGYGSRLHRSCPAGSCDGTDGIAERWPNLDALFCDPDDPDNCEACADRSMCDAPTYVDNGDGTVTSSCCGLTWQRNADAPNLDHADAEAHCAGLTLAGGGWRLPTLAELLTLIDPAFSPQIDPTYFEGTSTVMVWSSTPDHVWEGDMTGVVFQSGSVYNDDPEDLNQVRCVR